MAEEKISKILQIHLREFDKVKDEAIQRIGFRDNMIYVTLVAVGGVASFAADSADRVYALLLIPWICLILGWMYIDNDAKISAIGRYIQNHLAEEIRKQVGADMPGTPILAWESFHRRERDRKYRKALQFIINEITFCVSGLAALEIFRRESVDRLQTVEGYVWLAELCLVVGLGVLFLVLLFGDLRSKTHWIQPEV